MLESEESVQKLKNYLKKKGFQLNDIEIEKIAQNLYELGLFLVRLKVKQHFIVPKSKEVVEVKIFPQKKSD